MKSTVNVRSPSYISCHVVYVVVFERLAVDVKCGTDLRFVFVLSAGRMLSLDSNVSTPALVCGQRFWPLKIVPF
jgi:hypothetical protein